MTHYGALSLVYMSTGDIALPFDAFLFYLGEGNLAYMINFDHDQIFIFRIGCYRNVLGIVSSM